jgi:exodeoxyribonuclease VII large subunit
MSETPLPPNAPEAGSNLPEYSVGEVSRAVKSTLEGAFGHIRVRGEVSRPNYHSSGHLYFTLKDEEAVLDAVCWRGAVGRLGLKVEEGMELIVTGRISSYPRSSKYQIVIESVELAGEGALLKLLEDRRKKLAAEGLFDEARKRELPYLPSVIGVVTSPTGAVIRDILHRLADRFPRHVLLWPVPVQGEAAAEKIAAAIAGFNAIAPGGAVPRPDLLIVARGGGSLEDLWAFNEEVVVRAAAASEIPLISAIGHETDTTLIDFASDRRAPTPTAAAEMAVPVRADLAARVIDASRRMMGGMNRLRDERRVRLEGLARGLPDPHRLMESAMQTLDDKSERLGNARNNFLRVKAEELARRAAGLGKRPLLDAIAHGGKSLTALAGRLEPAALRLLADAGSRLNGVAVLLQSVSYERVLERGFALVRGVDGNPITSVAGAVAGADVAIRFSDGEAAARITEGAAPRQPAPKRRSAKKKSDDDDQGTLL